MSLRDLREPTTSEEHAQAVRDAEARLGRKLTASETRIDIVGQDRDLKNGKTRLVAAVEKEQRRAIEQWVTTGQPIQLHVTDEMMSVLGDLHDAGTEHAERELEQAGVTLA